MPPADPYSRKLGQPRGTGSTRAPTGTLRAACATGILAATLTAVHISCCGTRPGSAQGPRREPACCLLSRVTSRNEAEFVAIDINEGSRTDATVTTALEGCGSEANQFDNRRFD